MVLCVREQPDRDVEQDTVYIWKSPDFEEEEGATLTTQEFLDEVISYYWGAQYKKSKLQIVEEEPGEESDDFLNFFD